jgi:thioesterase domain-containing protein
MYRVLLILVALSAAIISSTKTSQAVEVYLFRGAGDFSFVQKSLHFSRGLDKMAKLLAGAGIHSRITRWENTAAIYREISKRRPQSVAFIGHSMGAIAAMSMASKMKGIGVRVAYVGLIDIPGPIGAVSSNVELAENFYHAFPVYGMLPRPSSHKGIIANHYIFGQIHISMDDSSRIQNAMISAIWQADDRDLRTQFARTQNQSTNGNEEIDRTVTASIRRD